MNASFPYDVDVGTHILDELKAHSKQAFVVCQPGSVTIAKKVAQVLEEQKVHVQLFELPDGENAKTMQSLGTLYEAAVEGHLERSATVYAVGGGCVGDAAGFFAATFMRGIAVVQIPTTLLSMVDSGIGGKTGINVANTKNMAGAFWQPKQMVCDVSVLETLPKEQMRNGLAEVIKHGLILDEAYFQFAEKNMESILSKEPDILEQTVAQSVRIKAAVVEKDEREANERMKLNYGHTVGHGIEAVSG
ncbi:MAG TPA: 3-dehydroquinate synthase family protein, partial [Candidatus Norongarragalinales archaeon]|nr:3-dehydroquinate synthase family protein [Candidatus Norongarragalinales archaeon]